MLSKFGKAVRKLRIDKGVTLKAMADALDKTSAFLSSVETGRKNPPAPLVFAIADYFDMDSAGRQQLLKLAEESKSDVQISLGGFSDSQREVAVSFARQFSSLSFEELEQIKSLLDKNGEEP